MEYSQKQIAPRKRTFWKMVKTMFVPAQTIAKIMVGCSGKKGKRRLSMRNMQQAKEVFIRASVQVNRSSSRQIGSQKITCNESRATSNSFARANNNSGDANDDNTLVTLADTIADDQHGRSIINEPTPPPPAVSAAPLLPAPLTLEEAEILLNSLTLDEQPTTSDNNEHSTLRWELVDVEVVANPLHDEDDSVFISERETLNYGVNDSTAIEACTTRNQDEKNKGGSGDGQRHRSASISISDSPTLNTRHENANVSLPRSRTTADFNSSVEENDYSGWRKSSIEITSNPPVTLAFIPSGLCVGDRVVWVKDDHPEIGTVRWIGKIRQQFYSGIEFDKPVGNSSGIYGYGFGMYKRLFTCQLAYGRFVPVKELVLYKDYHDAGVKSGIVCVICRDDFLDTWEPDICPIGRETSCEDEIQPFNMVSTRCGHLYHWGCLDHWFNSKKRTEFHCPFCSKSMERNDVIRIFPSQI